jgi:hypothetical protein
MNGAPRVKGTGFLGIASSIREVLGNEVYERTLGELPGPVANALRYGGVTPSAWVPLEWHVALHDAVVTASKSGPGVCRRVAKHTTTAHFNGVYRVLARLAGPETVFPRASTILGTYYSHAHIRVHEVRKGFTRTEFHGCEGFTPAIWENICGACEAILEISGASAVRMRVVSGAREGDAAMVVEGRWL